MGKWDNRRNIGHISRIGSLAPTQRSPIFGLRGGFETTSNDIKEGRAK